MSNGTIATPDFDEMPIGKLREYASHLQIALPKTAKKDEIKQAILNRLAHRTSAVLADPKGKIPPGHAKIIINEDSTPGNKNFPVYLNANGYQCTIPRGKEVIVPMRVVRVLQDAKAKRVVQQEVQDNYGRATFQQSTVTVPSYPFQLLGSTPGPEPLTSLEVQKRKKEGPRKRYREMFGRYPRPAELNRAIERGFIKLDEEEQLALPTAMLPEEETTEE